MTLKSHYSYYNILWPATIFTSKYWVYSLCVFTKLFLSMYAAVIGIILYCLLFKREDSAHSPSIKGMQAIACKGYQGKSGMLGHR